MTGVFHSHGWRLCDDSFDTGSHGLDLLDDTLGVSVFVSRRERVLYFHPATKDAVGNVEHVLLDLVLPKLLAHDGHLVLHGGLVGSPEASIGFIAPSGHGKSTLTASLHKRGLALMSDDAILLRETPEGYRAARLYPSLRLFPDSLERLFPGAEGTSMVADYTDKLRVPFAEGPETAPLAALFRLADPAREIRITRLSAAEACMALIANSFALDTADGAETRRRFVQATAVARQVPVYDLHYPRDYAALPKVQARIFETIGFSPFKDAPA